MKESETEGCRNLLKALYITTKTPLIHKYWGFFKPDIHPCLPYIFQINITGNTCNSAYVNRQNFWTVKKYEILLILKHVNKKIM